jgi:hypothetical protein
MIKTLKLCMLALLVPATIYTKASVTFPKETAVYLLNELSMNENPSLPSEEAFSLALRGMESLKRQPGLVKKDILTVIDFSLPSTEKRMWIIDLQNKKVLFNDYVAHGRNSGDAKAGTFSNITGSYQSSIGFYVTGDTYQGKHGLSLYLDGMDREFNGNARSRAIVMHGAEYVSPGFITQTGRLGRSLGCPAVSVDIHEKVIGAIQGGSAMFIYYPDPVFLEKSEILNPPVI